MKLNRLVVLGAVAALAVSMTVLTGCSGGSTGSASVGTVNVAGSDTMVNMAGEWAQTFMATNPDVQVSVKGGGSGTGVAALLNKTVDIANASRELKDEEKTQGQSAGLNLVTTAVARDGVAVIVNTANPVADITEANLAKIYRGEITNWKDVGGSDAPIVLLGRDSSSGTYAFVLEEVLGKDGNYAKSMQNLQSNQAIVDQVGKSPNAIGYVGLGYENDTIKVITVDGKTADTASVLDGSYPLARALNMITDGEPSGVAKTYIDWILGDEGQKIVTEQGFVPVK